MALAAAEVLHLLAEAGDAADRDSLGAGDESRQPRRASATSRGLNTETGGLSHDECLHLEVTRLAQELRDELSSDKRRGNALGPAGSARTRTGHLTSGTSSHAESSSAQYTATLTTPPLPLLAPAEPSPNPPSDEAPVSLHPEALFVEEVDACTGHAAEVSTSSRTDPVHPSTPQHSPYRPGVQRILGVARTLCRWIMGMRRVCTTLATTASGLLLAGRPPSFSHAVVVLLRGSPVLLDSLLPALSWMNLVPCSQTTGLCSSSAIICLMLYPAMSGASGIAFVGRVACLAAETSYSLLASWAKISTSASQFVHNSSQTCRLTAAAMGRRGSHVFEMLPAIDFGLTSAAFLHLVLSSSLRWRSGKGAPMVFGEVPSDLKELGWMAAIMYEPELPAAVSHRGRTLHLVKPLTDSVMAVYATKDLLTAGDDLAFVEGEVAICHRGTWSARDLPDDLHVMCGTFRSSFRYRDAKSRTAEMLRMWPSAKFIHVGHSLGGTVAMALVAKLPQRVDAEAHAFNPGVSFEGFFGPRSTVHLIEKDFIGYCTPAHPGCRTCVYPAHKGVKYLPWFAHPHSVSNFH